MFLGISCGNTLTHKYLNKNDPEDLNKHSPFWTLGAPWLPGLPLPIPPSEKHKSISVNHTPGEVCLLSMKLSPMTSPIMKTRHTADAIQSFFRASRLSPLSSDSMALLPWQCNPTGLVGSPPAAPPLGCGLSGAGNVLLGTGGERMS